MTAEPRLHHRLHGLHLHHLDLLRRHHPAAAKRHGLMGANEAKKALLEPLRTELGGKAGAVVLFSRTEDNTVIGKIANTLARELGQTGIRVNAIAPGRFYSEMTRGAWQDPEADAYKAELQRIPANRYGDIHDIAGVAILLCSRAGAYAKEAQERRQDECALAACGRAARRQA